VEGNTMNERQTTTFQLRLTGTRGRGALLMASVGAGLAVLLAAGVAVDVAGTHSPIAR
jgi:hypothetical protein